MVDLSPTRPTSTSLSRKEFFKAAGAVLLAPALLTLAVSAQGQQPTQPINMLPLRISSVTVQNGQLVANGLLGNHAFTSPITLTPSANPANPLAAPILDLSLGPINLNLLGLVVTTSKICLTVTAYQGGGLLGDLLYGLANLLNGGGSLLQFLNGLSTSNLVTLLNGIASLFNNVLGSLTSSRAITGVSGPSTNILHLALGPLTLNLLGLVVHLDNCANGPVTLDITAVPGQLLGDLLSSLANLLNNAHASQTAIAALERNIARAILALL